MHVHSKSSSFYQSTRIELFFFTVFITTNYFVLFKIQTNFNVTATPFISRQVHQWPAGVLPKENGNRDGNISNRVPISAQYIPQQMSSISMPVLPVIKIIIDMKQMILYFVLFQQTYGFQYSGPLTTRHNNRDLDSARSFRPVVLPNGTIQIRLREGIRLVLHEIPWPIC